MRARKADEPGGPTFPGKRAEQKESWMVVEDPPNMSRAQETALWMGGLELKKGITSGSFQTTVYQLLKRKC